MNATVVTVSTEQVRRTGDLVGIAIVERLDRIAQLLEAGQYPMVVTVTGKREREGT